MRACSLAILRLLKLVVLSFCISGNVSVKAKPKKMNPLQESLAKQIVQEPQGCLSDSSLVCGIKSQSEVRRFQSEGATFSLAPNTILIRVSRGQWYLSKGEVLVNSVNSTTLRTQFGEVLADGPMSVMVSSEKGLVSVIPLNEDCVVVPMGSETPYLVNSGLVAKLEGRDQKGYGYLRIAQSSPLARVIKQWGQLHLGAPVELSKLVEQYRLKWGVQADRLSAAQKQVYQREVAAAKAAQNKRRARQRRYEAESKKLRDLFKNKNYY
ncbi:MAG: hypothetical protein HRT45_11555 [Bdellovibrionales bacterium]|nr:hypothetical protein [Bdellovibrionales bacterium]